MELEILKDFGLSEAEIKILTALLRLGNAKAGEVVKESKTQNSVTHYALKKLISRGLVTYYEHKRVRYYQPCEYDALLRYADEKRASLKDKIAEIKSSTRSLHTAHSKVFESLSGFRSMCYEMIDGAEPGDDYVFFAHHSIDTELDSAANKFYGDFTTERRNRGIKIRGLAHKSIKEQFERFYPSIDHVIFTDEVILKNISICNSNVLMTPWEVGASPVSFLLKSDALAQQFRDQFEYLWERYTRNDHSSYRYI